MGRLIVAFLAFTLSMAAAQNFLMVGSRGGGGFTATSSDGLAWTEDSTSFSSLLSLTASLFFSSNGQFYVVGGGTAAEVRTSFTAAAGTWSALASDATTPVSTFSCICASDDIIIIGGQAGPPGSPGDVPQSQIVYVGGASGPFNAIPNPGGVWGNGATTGFATACTYGDGMFVLAISTPNGNVLLTSNNNAASWDESNVPTALNARANPILSIHRGDRWFIAGETLDNAPVVSYSASSNLNWQDGDPWTSGTTTQIKNALSASGQIYVGARVAVGSTSEFMISNSQPFPRVWSSATATPSLGTTNFVQNIKFQPLDNRFYSVVSNDSFCQWYESADLGVSWTQASTVVGNCSDLAIRTSVSATSTTPSPTSTAANTTLTTASTTMSTTMVSTSTTMMPTTTMMATTNPSPVIPGGTNFTVNVNVTVENIDFEPGSGLIVTSGVVLTVLNRTNVDGLIIFLGDSPLSGEVVVISTPNQPAEGVVASVVLDNNDDGCRMGAVSQTSQTISVVVTQTPSCGGGETAGLSLGAIVGIAVACVLVGILAAIILVYLMVRHRRKKTMADARALHQTEQENVAHLAALAATETRKTSWFGKGERKMNSGENLGQMAAAGSKASAERKVSFGGENLARQASIEARASRKSSMTLLDVGTDSDIE